MNQPADPALTIKVNTRDVVAPARELTYAQVAALAFPGDAPSDTVGYTITFSRAQKPHEGNLVEGQTVTIKHGTIFNVTRTTRS